MRFQGCGIYKIENLMNAKKYIGQSVHIEARWTTHKQTAFQENNGAYERPLYRDIRKYGIENFSFEVLEYCSPEELNDREVYWIQYYNSYQKGYNLTKGGNTPTKVDIEKLRKMWDDGYTSVEIQKEFNICKETVRKYLTGYSDYNTITSHRRGALKSEKVLSSFQNKEGYAPLCQYDLNGKLIHIWDSIKQATKETGITGIPQCVRGEYYSSGGFRWARQGQELISLNSFKTKNSKVILNEEEVKEIKELLMTGLSQSKIAEQYGVSRWTISSINTGKHWNDGGIYPIYDYKNKKANR